MVTLSCLLDLTTRQLCTSTTCILGNGNNRQLKNKYVIPDGDKSSSIFHISSTFLFKGVVHHFDMINNLPSFLPKIVNTCLESTYMTSLQALDT